MWKWASEALKDQCSLFITSLAPRSALRNPDIEAAVVKATNHDDSHIDYVSAQRIFTWIRLSGDYIHPVLQALSYRMKRTRSWTVALKGLMLLHGVFTCKVPAIQKIGQLPFDLSNFKDRNFDMRHHEAFIRAYFTYLERKSLFMFQHLQEQEEKAKEGKESNGITKTKQKLSSMMQDLEWIEKLQGLLGFLLKIRPHRDSMMNVLVLEAMDCIMIEIFDIYSRICNGIAAVLVRIYTTATTKAEATKVMSILKKAMVQGEDLSQYINLCSELGVMKAKKFPKIHRIPEEDIRELEHIIKKDSDQPKTEQFVPKEDKSVSVQEDEKSKKTDEQKDSRTDFETTITDNWELVDEEQETNHDRDQDPSVPETKDDTGTNRLAGETPDLITCDDSEGMKSDADLPNQRG